MRLALISDIHGNYKAFEAFLAYIGKRKIDGVLCLGDYVTDSPYPEKTLSLLYEMREKYPCVMVRGNREDYLIDHFYHSQAWKISSATGSLYYTFQRLKETDIRFFESLPHVRQFIKDGCPSTLICHGSPTEIRGNFVHDPKGKDVALQHLKERYLFGGHTHHQEVYNKFGKTYVNPGSLGLAIDGVGRHAQFSVLHTKEEQKEISWQVEQISIPYDTDSFIQDFTVSGLDEYGMILTKAIKKTLITGINYFYKTIKEVTDTVDQPLWEIPELFWQQAAEKFDL